MDISKLKAKRRYEITSGLKNCEIRRISPKEYSEQIYDVYNASVQSYKATGQAIKQESFIAQCIKHDKDVEIEYYAAFVKENGELAGYALNHVFGDYVNFTTMKFMPKYLSKKVSAALIYTMLIEYLNMQNKKYVNDGERSVRHATNFQDYLIKYFGFRKAYCKLNIQYRPIVKMAIKVLYPFRKLIKKFTSNQVLNNVNALLDMEVIRRSFKKQI